MTRPAKRATSQPGPATRRRPLRRRASSLVVTLLVIVVLSTIVVAFMQSMSVERLTAKSAANTLRARLAAEAGLDTAIKQIELGIGTNQAYLVGLTNGPNTFGPVTVIGQTNLTDPSQIMPLISGNLSELANFPSPSLSNSIVSYLNFRTNLSPTDTVNLNIRNRLIQETSSTNQYRAPWVYLTNNEGVTNARFAYIILDEFARINPRFHGTANRNNATNWFPGVSGVQLHTGGTNLLSATEATNAIAIKNQLLSLHSIGQAFASRSEYESKKHLISVNNSTSPDVIPLGYYSNTTFIPFPDGGLPKFNINELSTNTAFGASSTDRANNIASIITRNLPGFSRRDFGLQTEDPTGQKYAGRVAASIVDYIDADTIPTFVNGGEPAGKELSPYVVMVAEKNVWLSEAAGAGTTWTIQFATQFSIQLWNPYSIPVTGTARLEVFNRQYIELPDGGTQTDLSNYTPPSVSVTLQPNEFKAIDFQQAQQPFTNFLNRPSSSSARYPRWPQTSSGASSLVGHPQFRFFWNENLTDMNRSEPIMEPPASAGLPRGVYTFPSIGTIRWSFAFLPSNTPNTVSDPRITYLCQSDWASANNIALAMWQGRQTDTGGRTQNFTSTWAARDYIRQNSLNQGTALASTSSLPSAVPTRYNTNDATLAPAIIRNASMQSIGELGHIFDPVQMNDTGGNVLGGNPATYNRPGGGFSLRIGQPEFSQFTNSGVRAIELVDLFTVNTTNSASPVFPAVRGRINVNTASEEVLEALFYRINVTSDSAFTNSTVLAPQAKTLAQLTMSNRPYLRKSDLHKITSGLANSTNFSPSLGSGNLGTSSTAQFPLAMVFDRAREEAFGKMIELTTVQSRAFRVYVVSQSLGSNLKPLGVSALEATLTIPTDSTGNLAPVVSDINWEY